MRYSDYARYDYETGMSEDVVNADLDAARAAELAAIEREIGRQECDRRNLGRVSRALATHLSNDRRGEPDDGDIDALRLLNDIAIQIDAAQDEAHARWRRLHAEGAE